MGFKKDSGIYNESMKWWKVKHRKVSAFLLARVIESGALKATDQGGNTELHVITCRFGMIAW